MQRLADEFKGVTQWVGAVGRFLTRRKPTLRYWNNWSSEYNAMGRILRPIGAVVRKISRVVWLLGSFVWRTVFWEWWLGYGEQPIRVLFVSIVVLGATWLLYWKCGNFVLDDGKIGSPTWQDALYHSLISFTALGYGSWATEPVGWTLWLGAAESFVGIFSVVFFSITLTLRITR